ncbi:EndoU domain-containing protein [Avibacterium sp. 21-586]|uniref:EndoU domain-containing protein n=1 Tax=Avibacterium sp. 21-586 TaxID=2911534 RepID=UPI0022471E8D|nr:EndoU domain-containing protein [Avibacterium sp. 21-586]
MLKGHLNNRGNAVGYHHEPSGTQARVTEYTSPPNAQGVYKGKVALQGKDSNQWVPKRAESTFFPQSWSEARVKYEITEAYKKRPDNLLDDKGFIATTPSGILIKFVPPTQDGKVKQWRAWPLQQTGE